MSRVKRFDPPPFIGEESITPQNLEIAFKQLQEIINNMLDGYREIRYVVPLKPEEGMTVVADGTSWNPGSGAGTYEYKGGTWVKL